MESEYIVLFTSSLTLIVSLLVFIIKVCFKSKCSDVNCCFGLIKIHRNTSEETQNISLSEINVSPSRVQASGT